MSISAASPRTRISAGTFSRLRSSLTLPVVVLPGREEVDQRQQLLGIIAAAAGLADIGGELAIDGDERHALHLVRVGDLLRLLQLRVDVEGVVRLREGVPVHSVLHSPGLLLLERVLLAVGY